MKNTTRLLSPALLLLLVPACDTDGQTPDQPAESTIEESVSIHPVITAETPSDDADSDSTSPSAADGFADNAGMEQLPGFDMGVALVGEKDVALDWDDQDGADSYEIWRTRDIPYFYPGMIGSEMIASGVTDTTYTDTTGYESVAYYYIVQANSGATSTTVGRFVHKLEPGYNKVSQPLVTGVTSGLEFISQFTAEEASGSTYLWNPQSQRYVRARPNNDYTYAPGQCPILRHKWSGKHFNKSSVGYVPHYGEMGLPLYEGHNYVTVPLWYGELMASELLENLPEDAAIAYFTRQGPSDPYTNDGGEDFLIGQGDCIAVTLTSDAAWPPPSDAKASLSTLWNNGIPDAFERYNEDDAASNVGGGFHMYPAPNTGWFGTREAFQIGQPISGDFAISSRIYLTAADGSDILNPSTWNIGGIMIRDAEATEGPTNFHVGIGNANLPVPQLETKSTQKGSSSVDIEPWLGYEGELRICRVGDVVQALVREVRGDEWTVIRSVNRPDLGDTLQAGPIAYSDQSAPDLHVQNDYMKVMTINTLADCVLDDLPFGDEDE